MIIMNWLAVFLTPRPTRVLLRLARFAETPQPRHSSFSYGESSRKIALTFFDFARADFLFRRRGQFFCSASRYALAAGTAHKKKFSPSNSPNFCPLAGTLA